MAGQLSTHSARNRSCGLQAAGLHLWERSAEGPGG